jgi:branched-chain amino acid transport system permease protein
MSQIDFRRAIRFGTLFGIIAASVSAIGMVVTFDERDIITGVLTFGQVLLYSTAIIAGYASLQVREEGNRVGSGLITGFLAGIFTALPLVVLILISVLFPNIRDQLVNVSAALIEILTFGLGPGLGSFVLVIVMAILGAIGAGFHLLPERIERPLLVGIMTTLGIGLFADIFRNIFSQLSPPHTVIRFIFGLQGIQPQTALVIFSFAAGITAWWNARGRERLQSRREIQTEEQRQRNRWISIGLIIVLVLALPWISGIYVTNVFDQVGIFILMGIGLNIVVGYAGLLDLGYVAFFAIGAYVMGLVTSEGGLGLGLSFWIALPLAVLAAALFGLLLGIPVLRMRGDYLAIVTLGFGEIIRVLAASDLLKPVIGGAQGILKIGKPVIFGVEFIKPQSFYYLILAGCILAAFVSTRLRDARLGRQWMALREDEDVAEAMGIHLVNTKLLAFAFGAAFGGLAGAIFASRLSSIFPNSFQLLISINVLCLIIVGGIGSLPGVVLGAFVLVGLPELLSEFNQYRLLIYGALLIATMILRPEGLWPSPIRKRELHAENEIASREGVLHEDVHDLV